jgi:hypothetical protein
MPVRVAGLGVLIAANVLAMVHAALNAACPILTPHPECGLTCGLVWE